MGRRAPFHPEQELKAGGRAWVMVMASAATEYRVDIFVLVLSVSVGEGGCIGVVVEC